VEIAVEDGLLRAAAQHFGHAWTGPATQTPSAAARVGALRRQVC
jgi:hypothetical protein